MKKAMVKVQLFFRHTYKYTLHIHSVRLGTTYLTETEFFLLKVL